MSYKKLTHPKKAVKVSKQLPSPEEAIKILKENGCSSGVISHCKTVAGLAVKIAEKCVMNGIDVNVQLVRVGALLHDIGRSKTHSIHHTIVGADIARSLNLPASIILIIERHVGGGITAEEASELGWRKKSHMPETLEEKIVAYADKLVAGSKITSIRKTIERFRKELGADHPAIERVMALHREISNVCQESEK